MPFDTLATAAITDDLRHTLVAGRLQRIIQPSSNAVALSVYAHGTQHWLVLSADPRWARIARTEERLAKAFPTPSPFVMLLRKYLEGGILHEVEHTPYERIITLFCRRAGEQVEVIVEVMGKHSNVILADSAGQILGALKIVPPRLSRVRPVLVGHAYAPPPAQGRNTAIFDPGPRLDPARDPDNVLAALESVNGDTPLAAALVGLLPGCSPFVAEQIALRADLTGVRMVREAAISRVVEAAEAMYRLYQTREWSPCTFVDSRDRLDFAPYIPLAVTQVRPASSISAAVEECAGRTESRNALGFLQQTLLRRVETQLSAARRKIASLEQGLQMAAKADDVKTQGQLVLAYQYAFDPGTPELAVPDLDLVIPLDPTLGAVDNAERLFKRYRKLRDAARRLPGLIEEARAEAERLQDIAAFVELARSEADLVELGRQLGDPADGRGKRPVKKPRQPQRFHLDGYVATVGRNARDNEDVVFRLASRQDLWFHARERTGAHVVLSPGTEPPDRIIEATAELAAFFSAGRSDTYVDVDVTLVRSVRKVPGGPPGKVTYSQFRTVRVRPTMDGWQAG